MSTKTDTLGNYEQMQAVARIAALIPLDDVQAVVRELDLIDAAMPIMDPTRYREIMGTKGGHDQFARAFLRFRQELAALMVGSGEVD